MEKVSIVIPFYNSKKYIERCIQSLLEQTYDNFEAIFVNDGSNDGGEKIFEKISDKRIKLVNNKKSGVSKARNEGLKHVSGAYFSFLDIDDMYKNNYIEEMVKHIEKYNADIVLCDYTEVYDKYEKNIDIQYKNLLLDYNAIRNKLIPAMIGKINKKENIDNIRGLVWRTFIRKKFYDKNKILFDENVVVAEDLLFLIDLYSCASKIYICSQNLYLYNRYSGTTLDCYIENYLERQMYFHKKLVSCLNKYKLFEIKNMKERYAMNRLRMYTTMCSNAVRNPNKDMILKELEEISKAYNNDKYVKLINHNIDYIYKVNILLLQHNCVKTIKNIYSWKERIRRKKLCA